MQDIEDFPSEANSQKDVIPDRKKNKGGTCGDHSTKWRSQQIFDRQI